MTLTEYFHLIINQPPVKEPKMFDNFKAYVMGLFSNNDTKEELSTPSKEEPVDTWGFSMDTHAYFGVFSQEDFPAIHSRISGEQHTWMEVVDDILDVISVHYGFNVKEQVYYSVNYPLNDINRNTGNPLPGYGRCLNDEKLQLLLLAHPELYEMVYPELYETVSFDQKIV